MCVCVCGAKKFGKPSPLHTGPKAHAEEEEMFESEQRRSKLPGRRKWHAIKDSLPGRPKQKGLT